MFTVEQEEIFNYVIAIYQDILVKSNEDVFYKGAKLTFVKGLTTLALLEPDLLIESNESDVLNKISETLPENHPVKVYFKEINFLPEKIKEHIVSSTVITAEKIKDILNIYQTSS